VRRRPERCGAVVGSPAQISCATGAPAGYRAGVLTAYRRLFAIPGAPAFSAAGFVMRLPLAMVGLGCVLLITRTGGSYTLAGAVSATFWLFSSLAAPGAGAARRPVRAGPGAGRLGRPGGGGDPGPGGGGAAACAGLGAVRAGRAHRHRLRACKSARWSAAAGRTPPRAPAWARPPTPQVWFDPGPASGRSFEVAVLPGVPECADGHGP
jgi:hypothetical protein